VTTFGRIEVLKDHILCQSTSKFGMSQRTQVILCTMGQAMVFEEGSEVLEELLGLKLSAKQIQRVSEHYGEKFDGLIEANCRAVIPEVANKDAEPAYVMVDGSMLCMRGDNRWREMKLGRIFKGSQVIDIQHNRRQIFSSIYVSHLGGVDQFFFKLERHLTRYKKKIIIGDGAPWIWKWAEDNYPGAIQILDFFHAKEKLVIFAKHQFLDEQKRICWIEQQCENLLDNQVQKIIVNLQSIKPQTTQAHEAKEKSINYYIEHEDRMMYKSYRDQGYMIGSGPIEAAHRSVLQQRMKLSGQRWSEQGAQAIANLRCYRKADQWHIVQKVVIAAA
jgi:hypothetical protein